MHLGNEHKAELSICEMQLVKDMLHVARTDNNRYKRLCKRIDVKSLLVTKIGQEE